MASLGGGGAEKSSALLSEMLIDFRYDVHIITILDRIDYNFKGQLLNLGKLKSEQKSLLNKIKRFLVFKNYIKANSFDYIIDSRPRKGLFNEYLISKYIYKSCKVIYCVRSYNTQVYINSKQFFAKLLYRNAYKIIAVSKEISNKLKATYNFKNLAVIHNPIDNNLIADGSKADEAENYILFYGRLDDDVKNIKLLLKSFSESNLIEANFRLKILGEGKDRALLEDYVNELDVASYVDFLGFKTQTSLIVSKAYVTVLTSRYEGFPRVLIESLALGTPVVSVNCKSGPSEIVIDEYNGLLVENYNQQAFTTALNRMVADKKLYLHCKSNSKLSVEKFHKDVIALQWQNLLK